MHDDDDTEEWDGGDDSYYTGYHDGHRDAQKEAIRQMWVDHAMMEYEIPLEPRVLH